MFNLLMENLNCNEIIDFYPDYTVYILRHLVTGKYQTFYTTFKYKISKILFIFDDWYQVAGIAYNIEEKNLTCHEIEYYQNNIENLS